MFAVELRGRLGAQLLKLAIPFFPIKVRACISEKITQEHTIAIKSLA